jgi:hypothetical protein
MTEGEADTGEAVLKVLGLTFALKQELTEKFKTIDIDYSDSPKSSFIVEADNQCGCIRCNGCWLNTIETTFGQ